MHIDAKLHLKAIKANQLLEQLRTQVHTRKDKNVEILSLSADVRTYSMFWVHYAVLVGVGITYAAFCICISLICIIQLYGLNVFED